MSDIKKDYWLSTWDIQIIDGDGDEDYGELKQTRRGRQRERHLKM